MSGYSITHKINGIRVVREEAILVAQITNLVQNMMYEIGFECPLTIEEQMKVLENKQPFPFIHRLDPTFKVAVLPMKSTSVLEIEVEAHGVLGKAQFLVRGENPDQDEKRHILFLVLRFIRNSFNSKGQDNG